MGEKHPLLSEAGDRQLLAQGSGPGQCRRAETLMPRLDGDHDVDKVTPVQPGPAVDSEIFCPCQCLTGNSAAGKPAVTGMVSCSHLNLLTG